MMRFPVAATLLFVVGCAGPGGEPETTAPASPASGLRDAVTLYASFDDGLDAAFAKGDRRIYSAPSYKELDKRSPGYWGEDIAISYDVGKVGHALEFKSKNTKALFFSGQDNVAFSGDGWSGTISFWLSLDPATDLEPGFCDPIQVTDSAYNDSAIWVDFTKDDPRQFRLGVFGDLTNWKPEGEAQDDNTTFDKRVVVVDRPPFQKGEWTHVAITHEGLGTPGGIATLYLNGKAQGTATGIGEAFEWDMTNAAIRLGVNYVGLYDELALFDRPLTADEIGEIYGLDGGVASLLQ